MTSGVLKYTLVVRHPETAAATALVAGSEVPDWASDLVHADDLEAGADSQPAKKTPAKKAPSNKSGN